MKENHLHIISFNIPFPANYGGVIDVFHKIRWLHELGVKIHLHCFYYGREKANQLEQYCESVHYYPRRSFLSNFSSLPYIVNSRRHPALLQRLLQNDYPILFEGLHTCYLLFDEHLASRKKIFRESNIEHEYYRGLMASENSIWKNFYFKWEANRLQRFEKYLAHANLMLTVTEQDEIYFKNKFPGNTIHNISSFHENDSVSIKAGRGEYILFHGNLAVQENINAVEFILTQIAPFSNYPFKIAGLKPSDRIIEKASQLKNVEIIANPSDAAMQQLMDNAQIHLLYTSQTTGLKLKLINALHQGRFILLNQNILHGTHAAEECVVANTGQDFIAQIEILMHKNLMPDALQHRISFLKENFNNAKNAELLKQLIFD